MSYDDSIHLEEITSVSNNHPCVKIGNKKFRVTVELNDSDDEWFFEFSESVLKKAGVCPRTTWMHPMNLRRHSFTYNLRLKKNFYLM